MSGLTCRLILMAYMIQVHYIYAEETTKLLYSSRTSIWLLDVNRGNKIEIARTSNAVAIDYHKRKGYVYWTDVGTAKISRIRYPSTSNVTIIENVVSDDIGHPDGIAVDSVNDHIYWTDTGLDRIMRSNLDGSNETLIVYTGLEEPRAIELDTTNRWIYFSDWGSEPKIEKCMFDGSSRQTIITDDIQWPNGIALDFIQKRLYWCDAGKNQIKSSNFDGSDVQVILKSSLRVPHPFDIDIDEDNIYFTDWDYREVFKLSKSSSTLESLQVETNRPMGLKIYRTNLDQCYNYSTIQKEEKRSIGYTLDLSLDVPISDDDLQDNWYRVVSDNGDRIPTFPPGSLRCGTYMPIWLNGSLPSTEDDIVTRQVCKQTSTDTCGEKFDIQIKQCPGYYIYYLRNTSVNAAYCFGEGYVKCEDGLSSESGNYPGCSSTFPNNTISPEVNALLVEGKIYGVFPNPTPSLTPVFKCNFEDISNGSYVYDVYWYINGENITHHKNVLRNDINSTDLRDTDWIDRYKMNMDVKCSVRSRYSFDSIPGPFYFSENFKAGFFPEAYEFTVTEGETINISFTATVPVGCFLSDSRRAQCDMKFYISQPDNNEPSCSNNIVSRDIVFDLNNCGLELPSLAWNESVRLVVRGYSDGIYNHRDRTTFIRLSTRSNSPVPENNLWRSVNIPEITVTVLDKDSVLNSRLCQSYNDPHITTFDGILYHYMNVGEFVMYRNDIGPYWVHALFTNCGFGWEGSSCNGGLAIRSRTSLFVFRTVQEISRTEKFLLDQPFTEHINCDDSDMSVDHANNVYTITLPTGAEIRFTVSTWSRFISGITIKPSIYDIDVARGLCGVPSETKDSSDDYMHRYLGPVGDDKAFADSWRVNSTAEQLFVEEPEFLSEGINEGLEILNPVKRYCACDQEAGQTDDFEEYFSIKCNLTSDFCPSNLETSNEVGQFHTYCSTGNRRRRSTEYFHRRERRSTVDSDDIIDFQPLVYNDDVLRTDVPVLSFRSGWTQEKANKTCYERLHDTVPSNFMGISDEFFIESCIMDVMVTADTIFVQDTVEAMQTYTLVEVYRNETLSFLKTEDGNQTVLEYVTSLLCPDNCTGNGNCTSGICSCYGGFAGHDCSKEISEPPANISLPTSGLCGTRTRACRRTNIYGTFPSRNVWCKRKHFKILENKKEYTSNETIVKAEFRNAFMVSCDLETTRRKRSTPDTIIAEGYDISLSNDGSNFGDSISIVIYDEECYNCNSTSIQCVVLDGCPLFTTTRASTSEEETSSITSSHKLSTLPTGHGTTTLTTGTTLFTTQQDTTTSTSIKEKTPTVTTQQDSTSVTTEFETTPVTTQQDSTSVTLELKTAPVTTQQDSTSITTELKTTPVITQQDSTSVTTAVSTEQETTFKTTAVSTEQETTLMTSAVNTEQETTLMTTAVSTEQETTLMTTAFSTEQETVLTTAAVSTEQKKTLITATVSAEQKTTLKTTEQETNVVTTEQDTTTTDEDSTTRITEQTTTTLVKDTPVVTTKQDTTVRTTEQETTLESSEHETSLVSREHETTLTSTEHETTLVSTGQVTTTTKQDSTTRFTELETSTTFNTTTSSLVSTTEDVQTASTSIKPTDKLISKIDTPATTEDEILTSSSSWQDTDKSSDQLVIITSSVSVGGLIIIIIVVIAVVIAYYKTKPRNTSYNKDNIDGRLESEDWKIYNGKSGKLSEISINKWIPSQNDENYPSITNFKNAKRMDTSFSSLNTFKI